MVQTSVKAVVPAKTWIGRVVNFAGQMFPFYPNQIALFGGFVASFLFIATRLAPRPVLWWELLIGASTYMLLTFGLRVCDELKDFKTDAVNFPNRPLVTGVASLKDMRILLVVLLVFLPILQLPLWGTPVIPAFLFCVFYMFLMMKWFFLEHKIRPSLPLALYTHNPIVYIYQFYLLSFFMRNEQFPKLAAIFLIGDGLAATAWEIARKTRGSQEETQYMTYTKVWGRAIAPIILLVLVLVSYGLTFSAAYHGNFSNRPWAPLLAWGILAIPVLVLGASVVRFLLNSERAPPFRVMVESYKLILIVALFALLDW